MNKIVKQIGKSLSISFLSQIISSGTNFTLGLYLVRVMTPSDFGLYGIGLGICLLYTGAGNALFLVQMTVNVPNIAEEYKRVYLEGIFTLVLLFSMTTVLFALFIAFVLKFFEINYFTYIFSISITSVAFLLRDFFVRHAYILHDDKKVLYINTCTALCIGLFFYSINLFSETMTPETTLCLYSMSLFVSVMLGYVSSTLSIKPFVLHDILANAKGLLHGGAWALSGVVITWLQSQSYAFIVAFFYGTSGVGEINAARLLIAPMQFILPSINQVALPRLAELRERNLTRLFITYNYLIICYAVMSVAYVLFLYLGSDVLIPMIVGNNYSNIDLLVFSWSLFLIFQMLRVGNGLFLQALRCFRSLSLLNLISAIFVVTLTIVLIQIIGLEGSVLSIAFGEMFLSILLIRFVKHEKRKLY